MLLFDISERISIEDILQDGWMNEENIDRKEVKPKMFKMMERYKKLKKQAAKEKDN